MKKSTANQMHRKRRKNNLAWLFALLGILVLFLGTILAFLIFSNLSSEPAETVQEVSAVNVEKDIPETDMGDLIYHEPAAENVVMQGGFGYVNNIRLLHIATEEAGLMCWHREEAIPVLAFRMNRSIVQLPMV